MPCILPPKQESPPGLLSAKQILLWEWWCSHGIVPEKEGNKPPHLTQTTDTFVVYHILTSKESASVVDDLLIPFAS